MFHTPEEFAAFTDGERRFVAAAWRDDPARPYFVLPDGEAERHRYRARTELRCMFRDCRAPEITTVARVGRRDGFRHLDGSTEGHGGPESFHHISGKAVLVDYLRSTYPHLEVQAEQGIDTQRTRVADVMATNPVTGNRIAFEVQYASLSPTEWQARTDDYAAAGIPVVWLWGHVGSNMRATGFRGEGRPPMVGLSPTLETAAKAQPLLWLNPELGSIGIGYKMEPWDGTEVPMPVKGGQVELGIRPLSNFTLTPAGLNTALLGRMRENRDRAERRRLDEEARRARLSAERQKAWQAAPPRERPRSGNPAGLPLCTICREPIDEVLVAHGGKHLLRCRPRP